MRVAPAVNPPRALEIKDQSCAHIKLLQKASLECDHVVDSSDTVNWYSVQTQCRLRVFECEENLVVLKILKITVPRSTSFS